MDQSELLWRQYELWVGMYKHYLELVVKFNVFHYAVTGAILSFYFSRSDEPYVKYALVLPVLMNIALAGFFAWGSILLAPVREDVHALRTALGLQVEPEINVLAVLLRIFAVLYLVIALGVAAVLAWFSGT